MQVHQVYNWLVLHYMTYKICQAVTLNPIHKRKRKKKQAGAAYNTFLIYFHLPLENHQQITVKQEHNCTEIFLLRS